MAVIQRRRDGALLVAEAVTPSGGAVSPPAWRSCRVRRVRAGDGAPRVSRGDRTQIRQGQP